MSAERHEYLNLFVNRHGPPDVILKTKEVFVLFLIFMNVYLYACLISGCWLVYLLFLTNTEYSWPVKGGRAAVNDKHHQLEINQEDCTTAWIIKIINPLYLLFVIRDLNSSENSRVDNIETPTLTYIIRVKHDSGFGKNNGLPRPYDRLYSRAKVTCFRGLTSF